MSEFPQIEAILPHRLPEGGSARTVLFALRRIAIHGVRDAFAVNAMIGHFGIGYRAPLVLLRALVYEIAREAETNVIVAHCCAPRMTAHEHTILSALTYPETAAERFALLLGGDDRGRTVQTARALAKAMVARGRPITL